MTGLLSLIQEYLGQKVVLLNAQLGTSVVLKQVQTELDMERIGASESNIHYQLFITGTEDPGFESQYFDLINVSLDFIFLIANKNYTVYQQKFDRYIYNFRRILTYKKAPALSFSDRDISETLKIQDIKNVQITNGDRFEEGYYKPSVQFQLKIYDNTDLSQTINNSNTV